MQKPSRPATSKVFELIDPTVLKKLQRRYPRLRRLTPRYA